MSSGISAFIKQTRTTYLGEDYVNRPRTTEQDSFEASHEMDTPDEQFEENFADAVEELNTVTDKLLNKSGNVLSNKTKAQLQEQLEQTRLKLEQIAQNLVPVERTTSPMDMYYDRFKQMVLNSFKEQNPDTEIDAAVVAAMDSFLKMSFSPIKSLIETLGDDIAKIEDLFKKMEQNSQDYFPKMNMDEPQLIEIPNVAGDEDVPLGMTGKLDTTENADAPRKAQHRPKRKDDSLGE